MFSYSNFTPAFCNQQLKYAVGEVIGDSTDFNVMLIEIKVKLMAIMPSSMFFIVVLPSKFIPLEYHAEA